MKRIRNARFCLPAPAGAVSSVVLADDPRDFEQTQLESGVTGADIERFQDGQSLMVLDHDGPLRAAFSRDSGKTASASLWLFRRFACGPKSGQVVLRKVKALGNRTVMQDGDVVLLHQGWQTLPDH